MSFSSSDHKSGILFRAGRFFRESLSSEHRDYTTGSLRRAVLLLAIPMILETSLESVFALVDIFFVGRLGKESVATVGLTESVLTLVYSVAMGLSMAATAMVGHGDGMSGMTLAGGVSAAGTSPRPPPRCSSTSTGP